LQIRPRAVSASSHLALAAKPEDGPSTWNYYLSVNFTHFETRLLGPMNFPTQRKIPVASQASCCTRTTRHCPHRTLDHLTRSGYIEGIAQRLKSLLFRSPICYQKLSYTTRMQVAESIILRPFAQATSSMETPHNEQNRTP
jgi:hypothetical protein